MFLFLCALCVLSGEIFICNRIYEIVYLGLIDDYGLTPAFPIWYETSSRIPSELNIKELLIASFSRGKSR